MYVYERGIRKGWGDKGRGRRKGEKRTEKSRDTFVCHLVLASCC